MKINFPLPDDQQLHTYCSYCHSQLVVPIYKKGKRYTQCQECHKISARWLVIDPKITWWVDPLTKEYWHESVGAFIFNSQDKALFFKRIIYPFVYSIPSGHLDKGKTALQMIKIEIREETGLKPPWLKLFCEEDIFPDRCRRGADHHRWHLYVAKIAEPNPIVLTNDEAVDPLWLSLPKALTLKLTDPVRYFIEKYHRQINKAVEESHCK